jgi:hypothetical protein
MRDAPADPTAAPAGSATTVPCASCATPIDPASAYYSATGDMICSRCNAVADIQATEGRAVSAMVAVGYGTLAAALLSLVFNPMLLVSFLAVLQGSLALVSLLRGNWYRKRLGAHYYVVLLCTIVGTLIGAWPYFLILLAIVMVI